ncbi:hypothetical protein GCM10010349_72220 [Streptomyces flavofungini]|nr:response regulator transcription factor [Streptomyces flavofungini]GHC86247.1 hypothetical protein GCM10010349_72220 [Streptomyces flavofungini]
METPPPGTGTGPGTREPAPPGTGPAARVLVVDDDRTVAEVVTGYLDRAGYEVEQAEDGPAALERAAARRPDLVVLDLMLPGMDGLEVCRRLRERGPVPVIMLTARGDEDDRILGLEIGADDYVTKPFSPRELVLRVESVLRRSRASAPRPRPGGSLLCAAGLALDPAARRATKNGTELALTVREFDLLAFFLRYPGRAFGREELMRQVWGWDFGDLSTVTVHVRRLRGKVEDDPAAPRLIQTVWGVGYRLDGADSGAGADVADAGAVDEVAASPVPARSVDTPGPVPADAVEAPGGAPADPGAATAPGTAPTATAATPAPPKPPHTPPGEGTPRP